ARGVHEAEHHGVGLLAHVGDHVAVDQIVVVEREALRTGRLGGGWRVKPTDPAMLRRRHLAPRTFAGGASFVEPDADADGAISLPLRHPERFDLTQRLALEIGELEVLEHDVDELLERDVGLIVVGAGLIPRLVLAGALRAGLADHLAALGVAVSLSDARSVVSVDEAILADAADRDLDDPIAVLSDDGFLRDDVRDVLADRLADLHAMPRTVARGAIAPLGVRRGVRTEYGVGHPG